MLSERHMRRRKNNDFHARSKRFGRNQPVPKETGGARVSNNQSNPPSSPAGIFAEKEANVVSCRPGLSSLLFSSVCSTFAKPVNGGHKRYSLRSLSCTSASDVHLPTSATKVVRASADWDFKSSRHKPRKPKRNLGRLATTITDSGDGLRRGSEGKIQPVHPQFSTAPPSRKQIAPVVDDTGCSGGLYPVIDNIGCSNISLATDVSSLEHVMSHGYNGHVQRAPNSSESGRTLDSQFERCSKERHCPSRRGGRQEKITPMIMSPVYNSAEHVQDMGSLARSRRLQGSRRSSPGIAEQLFMLEASLQMGGIDVYDHHRDWRLDVDSMTYEDLLELGDRIGYVSTGLTEETISRCLKKIKASLLRTDSSFLSESDRKCSICQDEYDANDELGKLYCGHCYHSDCIKQWLLQKNLCPICKASASA